MPHARLVPIVLSLTLGLVLLPSIALAGPAADGSTTERAVRYERPGANARTPEVRTDALDQRVAAAKAEHEDDQAEREAAAATDVHKRQQAAHEPALIDKQISMLVKLIKISDEDVEMADMLFRLADLYLAKKAWHELQAGSLYEPIHEAEQ
jgi:hypothetical protein